MPPVGFELTISAGELPQTYALDFAATGIGFLPVSSFRYSNRDSREGRFCAKTEEVWPVTLHRLTCIADTSSAISPLVPLLLVRRFNTHNTDRWRRREWRRFVTHSCPADKIVPRQTAELTGTAISEVSHRSSWFCKGLWQWLIRYTNIIWDIRLWKFGFKGLSLDKRR